MTLQLLPCDGDGRPLPGQPATPWTACLALADGHWVGGGGFTAPPAAGAVEIGYFVHAPWRGRGLGRAIAAALVARAHAADPALAIVAHTARRAGEAPGASASARVLRALGFTAEGAVEDPEEGPAWRWRLPPAAPARPGSGPGATDNQAMSAAVPSAALATDPAAAPAAGEPARFLAQLRQALDDGGFVRLVLGKPRPGPGDDATLDKLLARRVRLRGQDQLSLVWRHRSKDITKNLPLAEAVALVGTLLGAPFHHAHLVTRSHDIQLATGKKGAWGLRIGRLAAAPGTAPADGTAAAAPAEAAAHDRARRYALTLDTPFLAELGITDAQHRLIPAMARKWRQINKFAEVLDHAIAQSPLAARDPAQPVRVLDFGAGRGYLTFAVHQRLLAAGRLPEVTGVELRAELTQQCNDAAARLALAGLHFATGDVRDFRAAASDIMIALHACDTATDVAMHFGVRSGAAIILCSPCCHKQLRPQMRSPALLQPMLRHGIHMTEQAEMLTDALRALLLQAEGYDTQVFEFISPEHTGKNKMVLAIRRAQPLPAAQRAALRTQVAELKAFYGVREQALETLLAADGPAGPSSANPGAAGPGADDEPPARPHPQPGPP